MEVKIEITEMPWVPVMVNGKGPYTFGIDTGYLGFCLSDHLANELGMETNEYDRALLESLAVGDLTFHKFEITVRDNSAISRMLNRRVDGLVGMDFLKHFEFTIDFSASVLSLTPLQETIGRPWAHPLPDTSYIRIKYSNRYIVVPAYINTSGPYEFVLDTGADLCVVSKDLAGQLELPKGELRPARGAVDVKECHSSEVRCFGVGNRKAEGLPVLVMDCADVSENAGTGIDGYLGRNFLKDTAITINCLDLLMSLRG